MNRFLGREGMLDDTKPTKNEHKSLMNNSNLDQVKLYKAIKEQHYSVKEKK